VIIKKVNQITQAKAWVKENDEHDDKECVGCFKGAALFSFILLLIPLAITLFIYKPFVELELKDGYCMDTKTLSSYNAKGSSGKSAAMYYETTIYDKINGTLIGESQGCYGTFSNSYFISAGITSDITKTYPYREFNGYIPSWLCSYISIESDFWDDIEGKSLTEVDDMLWIDEWYECKYEDIEKLYEHGEKDYMSVIPSYSSSYESIDKTDHYQASIAFSAIFGIIPAIFIILLLLTCIIEFGKLLGKCVKNTCSSTLNVMGLQVTSIEDQTSDKI